MAKFEVTLKQLRDARACFEGYNKLVVNVFNQPSVSNTHYIVFNSDQPITLLQILDSNGLLDAIWALRCIEGAKSEIRLFAVGCARMIQHLMTDQRSLGVLDVAEKFANGLATEEELNMARIAAFAAAEAAYAAADAAARAAADAAARAAADAAAEAAYAAARAAARATNAVAYVADAASDAAYLAAYAVDAAYEARGAAASVAVSTQQEALFRKLFAE